MSQILGFRKDRLGARLVTLANTLMLAKQYGCEAKYWWPEKSENHDMAISVEHPIFTAEFVAENLILAKGNDKPDVSRYQDLPELQGRMTSEDFHTRVRENKGENYLTQEGFFQFRFNGETVKDAKLRFADAVEGIKFSEEITSRLNHAIAHLREANEHLVALHIRRGDILDQGRWQHRNWTAKYSPDEFFEPALEQRDCSIVIFSDTPDVAQRLIGGRAHVQTPEGLLDLDNCSELQRDLLSLLLMSKCDEIVAPAVSAFSTSASLLGNVPITVVPRDLKPEVRMERYNLLLDRVLHTPASFYGEGDLAQSTGFAFLHALHIRKEKELFTVLKDRMSKRYLRSFYYPLIMALALANDDPEYCISAGKDAQSDEYLWSEDIEICIGLSCVAQHYLAEDQAAASRNFFAHYLYRKKVIPDLDAVMNYFLENDPDVGKLFMLDPVILDIYRYGKAKKRLFMVPVDDSILGGSLNNAIPLWVTAMDWQEIFSRKQVEKNIRNYPTFPGKLVPLPQEIKDAVSQHFKNEAALPSDDKSLVLLSFYAAILRLHGKHYRAGKVLRHCLKFNPNSAISLKRLADNFRDQGDAVNALNLLHQASACVPDHPGLLLILGLNMLQGGDYTNAEVCFEKAAQSGIDLQRVYEEWEKSLQKLGKRQKRLRVLKQAKTLFPDVEQFHKKFEQLSLSLS